MLDSVKTLRPKVAIVLYGEHEYGGGCSAAMVHDVRSAGKKSVIGSGRPLTRECLAEMLKLVADNVGGMSGLHLLPERVLAWNQAAGTLVWWAPSVVRPIYLAGEGEPVNGPFKWPPLVFYACGEVLACWALAKDQRPDADTPLFMPPLWNFYDNGGMCWGNVQPPTTLHPGVIDQWEACVYDTTFTHWNGRVKVKGNMVGGGYKGYIARLIKTGKGIPASRLVPADMNLGQMLEMVRS